VWVTVPAKTLERPKESDRRGIERFFMSGYGGGAAVEMVLKNVFMMAGAKECHFM